MNFGNFVLDGVLGEIGKKRSGTSMVVILHFGLKCQIYDLNNVCGEILVVEW